MKHRKLLLWPDPRHRAHVWSRGPLHRVNGMFPSVQQLLCSVVLLVVYEILGLLGELLLLLLLLLQLLVQFVTLVDFHSGKPQTQHQCLQGQDVQEEGDVIQSLRIGHIMLEEERFCIILTFYETTR